MCAKGTRYSFLKIFFKKIVNIFLIFEIFFLKNENYYLPAHINKILFNIWTMLTGVSQHLLINQLGFIYDLLQIPPTLKIGKILLFSCDLC